jgi:DNA-binding NtrC family response regulator
MKAHAAVPVDRPFVMVVEDEPLIRWTVVDVLTEAGFAVIEAGHADAALAILEAEGCKVQALFTDIDMPGSMNGLQLAYRARQNWPSLALLVASGKVRLAPHQLPPKSRFLPKPYDLDAVVTHVRELIATL